MSVEHLLEPFTLKDLSLPSRVVMAPMTRNKSPNNIPGPDVAAYYRRRSENHEAISIPAVQQRSQGKYHATNCPWKHRP
jgi:2,4-dienoyl-CoA reductase-like NADH-dependent reductase (Old Yellow Enzyme family)